MFGWGECAPTIVACPVGAALLPDHGELCSSSRNGSKYWWLTVRGRTFDYESARRLTATDSRLDFAYRVGSFNSSPPLLWAAYPQCRAEQGTAILPPGDISEPVGILRQPTQPTSAAAIRRATDTQPRRCRNDYVDPAPSLTQARIQHADGSTLILHWNPEALYLGIWIEPCVYARQDVVAIEPATAFDVSYEAVSNEIALSECRITVLEPHSQLRRSLSAAIGDSVRFLEGSKPPQRLQTPAQADI